MVYRLTCKPLFSHHFLSVDDHHTLIVLADTLSGEVVSDTIVSLSTVHADSGDSCRSVALADGCQFAAASVIDTVEVVHEEIARRGHAIALQHTTPPLPLEMGMG